jgi:DNA-directed RNA polymerase specialized sigma24 family protein
MQELVMPEPEAPVRLTQEEAQELVLRTVATQAESLLRTAYRHSLCDDDAHDAYQRSMEIFMRRARTLDPELASRWLHVVVKREAMEVRRGRSELVATEDIDFDRHESPDVSSPEDRLLSTDRATRAAEALRRLKPQELRAMWLRALGHSYADAAGNESRVERPTPLRVDNRAPATPVGLASPAPTASSNRFSATWSLPADQGTPIVAARYQLCQAGSCGPATDASSLTAVTDLALPAPGDATLRVWLVDERGHAGPEDAATLALSYQPPPAVDQAPPPVPPSPDPLVDPPPGTTLTPRPTAPSKHAATLALTATRRVGRRITIAGTMTPRAATGRVTVRYETRIGGRKHTTERRVTLSKGRFSLTLTLSKTLARPHAGVIVASYGGDAHTRSTSRRATLRLPR